MAQPIDYQAVLADLERRRDAFNGAIDDAITSLRRMLELTAGITSAVQTATPVSTPTAAAQVTLKAALNPYRDMSLPKAAMHELKMRGQPMTNQEIADALEAAGFTHGSSNFANLVGTALWRESQRKPGSVVRDGRQWLLAGWQQRESA